MIVVYLASPYTLGDVGKNVGVHINITNNLISQGYCVIAPLLSHFLHIAYPREWETWIKIDLELLSRSDVVYRAEGESAGADVEVREAEKLGIKVVNNADELAAWATEWAEKNGGKI